MTAAYWEIGRRIVEREQGGKNRASYGEALLERLSLDLTRRFGRGFSRQNLQQMRTFYLLWPVARIRQTVSGELGSITIQQAATDRSLNLTEVGARFPLPWSAYIQLLSVRSDAARSFYESEALRCGWSVRQLSRQIDSQFYERIALSRNRTAMLINAEGPLAGDIMTPDQAIKDPFVLEFLNLKDQYSESELEEALIGHLTDFLLELGDDFAFIARQRALRMDDRWFRVDLLFYHRRLRCLLILCASKGAAEARYALEGLPNVVLAAEYRTALPDEKLIADELARSCRALESRRIMRYSRKR